MRGPIRGDPQLLSLWGTPQQPGRRFRLLTAPGGDFGDSWDAFTATALAWHILAFTPARLRLCLHHEGDKPEPHQGDAGWVLLYLSSCLGVPRSPPKGDTRDHGDAPSMPYNVFASPLIYSVISSCEKKHQVLLAAAGFSVPLAWWGSGQGG